MRDAALIEKLVLRGKEAGEKVRNEFNGISHQQLNWKPSEQSWSIGQCLDHLIIADGTYFPLFKKITTGDFKMNSWERWSPLTGMWGRMMVNYLQETPRHKMKAPALIRPSIIKIDMGILPRFQQHLDEFIGHMGHCNEIDLDKTHITSPVNKFITYNLRHALTFLVSHEHRHINQAMRVKQNNAFPV